MTIQELRDKRAKAVADARAILDRVQAEGRDFNGEEQTRWDAFMGEVDMIGAQIQRQERMERIEGELRQTTTERVDANTSTRNDAEGGDDAETRAFASYMRDGIQRMSMDEVRALQADSSVSGGVFVPRQMVNRIIQNVDDIVQIRNYATVMQMEGSGSLGAVSLDTDPDDATWTTEILTGSEDSAMAFGKRELVPHPLAKRIKISNKLLRLVPNIAGIVQQRLAYKIAKPQESSFMTGSGSNQPLGLFTASSVAGISTGRDVSTGNTDTALTFDGLIEAQGALKGQYQGNARWLFNRTAITKIRKLKDGEGQYLWNANVREANGNDTLLGKEVISSEYCPNTFTTGLYVGMYADFSHYWIAESLAMSVQQLNELYAETNQRGYIVRAELDGMPTIEEAFVRVKLA